MSQLATSSEFSSYEAIPAAGGFPVFTGSRRVDGIYIYRISAGSEIYEFQDVDGNAYFKFGTNSHPITITQSWIAVNGLVITTTRDLSSSIIVTHSAIGV